MMHAATSCGLLVQSCSTRNLTGTRLQVKLFVETWTAQMTGNLFKILKADNKASLAEAVTSAEAGAKVTLPPAPLQSEYSGAKSIIECSLNGELHLLPSSQATAVQFSVGNGSG